MHVASFLLLAMGLLGAFDIYWFHGKKARLLARPECRTEAWIHVARGVVYSAQFAVVPNLRLSGLWVLALALLFVLDVGIAIADVLVEPESRAKQGGLPPGEYLAHIVLSVLAGATLLDVVTTARAWASMETAIVVEPHAPPWLRAALLLFSIGSLLVAIAEAIALVEAALPAPAPLHVSVRLPTSVERLWALTQDHRLHPQWDRRFSRIEMLADEIRTGTEMIYEKTILGLTIRGWGRYKLHKPLRQSTFEFGSSDPRSLIARGVGLWLYRSTGTNEVEFATSYTYEVRWGLFGRVFDRLIFRPLFQWYTEQSFRRLAREHFGVARPRVLGREGRRPLRFATS